MGDSSCAVQGLSHAPENSTGEETKVSTISAALGGSISFGRFLSESLDWGKWSSFCQKRHLEEVEKYSTPGSVAEKKAFFEAHYTKAAARKSAALLEQATATATANNTDLEMERNAVESNDEYSANSLNTIPEPEEPNLGKEDPGLEVDQLQKCVDSSPQIELSEVADDVENQYKVNDTELGNSPLKKQPLKERCLLNQENRDSTEKKPSVPTKPKVIIHKPSRIPTTPAPKLICPVKSVPRATPNKSAPNGKHGTESNEKKKSTLGSLHMSINFSQGRKGAITANKMNKTSPNIKKVEELRVVSKLRGIQGCSNHLITPTRASSNGVPKRASPTPKSEHGRVRTILDQRLSGGEKVDVRSCRDSIEYNSSTKIQGYSKSLDIRGNRFQAQIASPSLDFRTAERVEKRKKFSPNLEDKFRGKEAKKLQVQETAKEKAESEIKKLRQSLSFKARPLPAFYHSTEVPKVEVKKVQLTRPQSPKIGRTNKSEANSVLNFLRPPQPSSIKGNRSTHAKGKSSPALRSHITMKSINRIADSVSSSNN